MDVEVETRETRKGRKSTSCTVWIDGIWWCNTVLILCVMIRFNFIMNLMLVLICKSAQCS